MACSHKDICAVGNPLGQINQTCHGTHLSGQGLAIALSREPLNWSCTNTCPAVCQEGASVWTKSQMCRVPLGTNANALHGAATAHGDLKDSQEWPIKCGFREDAFAWNFWPLQIPFWGALPRGKWRPSHPASLSQTHVLEALGWAQPQNHTNLVTRLGFPGVSDKTQLFPHPSMVGL